MRDFLQVLFIKNRMCNKDGDMTILQTPVKIHKPACLRFTVHAVLIKCQLLLENFTGAKTNKVH